ncbi:MAG: hypothetical protein LCH54_05260 [Bacteroidetes bacterium]|nr:hypothetical protein [Bacteroidota bacterium]
MSELTRLGSPLSKRGDAEGRGVWFLKSASGEKCGSGSFTVIPDVEDPSTDGIRDPVFFLINSNTRWDGFATHIA